MADGDARKTPPSTGAPMASVSLPEDQKGEIGLVLPSSSGPKRKRRLADLSQDEIDEIVSLRGKLPQSAVGKRFGIEQTDVSQIQRFQKSKLTRPEDKRRVKDVEVVLPIVFGTISFWLGKKADEFHSHKWTVFVRAANNEDLGDIVKRVVFQLHPSFNDPTRVVESPPFELSETGWGEFEIGITIWLHPDASEKPIELFHGLKLYPEDDSGQNTKKPVVVETYEELVFTEPLDTFFHKVRKNPAVHLYGSGSALASGTAGNSPEVEVKPAKRERGDTKAHPLSMWFGKFSDTEELSRLGVARQQVASHIAKLEREYAAAEAECQSLRSSMVQ